MSDNFKQGNVLGQEWVNKDIFNEVLLKDLQNHDDITQYLFGPNTCFSVVNVRYDDVFLHGI